MKCSLTVTDKEQTHTHLCINTICKTVHLTSFVCDILLNQLTSCVFGTQEFLNVVNDGIRSWFKSIELCHDLAHVSWLFLLVYLVFFASMDRLHFSFNILVAAVFQNTAFKTAILSITHLYLIYFESDIGQSSFELAAFLLFCLHLYSSEWKMRYPASIQLVQYIYTVYDASPSFLSLRRSIV